MPAKKTLVKKTVKPATVVVETKKLSASTCCDTSSCCTSGSCCKTKGLGLVLTIINLILLLAVLWNQKNIEAMRVGGPANYKMVKEIYKSEGFKSQQQQQIQSALQLFSQPQGEQIQAQDQAQIQQNPELQIESAELPLE